MALTVTVLSGKNSDGEPLRLTLDSPRIVIGRSESCEVRLPDPSVSARHASIRARGSEYLIVDENSKNGSLFGSVLLSPQSPRVLKSGDQVRVGRVWLQFTIEPLAAPAANAAAARAFALALVARSLAERGEPTEPTIVVDSGPDVGKTLALAEAGRLYVLGRAAEAHMSLTDVAASRRHVGITNKGDRVVVQDLGSKGGATLDSVPLGSTETTFRPGAALGIGGNIFLLAHPTADALAEIERGPDEAMSPEERAALDEPHTTPPPEGDDDSASLQQTPTPSPVDDFTDTPNPAAVQSNTHARPKRSRDGWGLTDAAVVLLALGVLILSAAGWWLLSK